MTLIEDYYEVNEAEEVSVFWKVIQIALYAIAAGTGIWSGFTLALLRLKFNDRCYIFTNATTLGKKDMSDESWGNDFYCDIFQFCMISSFVVSFIWGAFFLMCGKGGKDPVGLPQPWRIVCLSFVFNLFYFLFTLVNAMIMQLGTDIFCARKKFKLYPYFLTENCDTIKHVIKTDVYLTSVEIEIVVKTSWGCAFVWLFLVILPLLRIMLGVDFRIYKICVFKIDDTVQNKEEEVLKITNYEDPSKISYELEEEAFCQQEATLNNLEKGMKKRTKSERKYIRPNFYMGTRFPQNPNAPFHMTADIRMLNREKKRLIPPEALNQVFRNSTVQGLGFRKSTMMQSNAEQIEKAELPTLLYQFYHNFPNETDDDDEDDDDDVDDNELNSSSTSQKPDLDDGWNESESGSEILLSESNRILKFKKQV